MVAVATAMALCATAVVASGPSLRPAPTEDPAPTTPRTAPAPPLAPPPGPAPAPAVPPVLTVTPARSRLVLGTVTEVAVAIAIAGTDAESFKPIRAVATVGSFELPQAAGSPGHFSARYRPPSERFPQVALLVVDFTNGSQHLLGSARIILGGSTVVPFHTSPGAAVTMRVAERLFGPVIADRQGHADIPIEVPPGVRVGVARAVDHNAAARETEVDLQLPPFLRVLVLAPPALEVGSLVEIALYAVESDGAPTPPLRLTLGASDGLVHPLGSGAFGEARFVYEAPRRLGAGAVALTATASGAIPGRADLAIPLAAGGPAGLVVVASPRKLVVGSGASATISIAAEDAFGNPTSALGAQASVDGRPFPVAFGPDGVGTLALAAPATFSGRDRIEISSWLGQLRTTEELHLTGGAPARIEMDVRDRRVVADGQQSTELHVQAVDRNGTPTVVPGLSWDTPEGRVRRVRVPRDGEYVAEYVPDRTREPHREVVSVMAAHDLRADASVEVTPPPIRLWAGARAGIFTNFGSTSGAVLFFEALRPFELHGVRFQAGGTLGYLHGELDLSGLDASGPGHIDIDQFPLSLIARWRAALPFRLEVAVDASLGLSWALTEIIAAPGKTPVQGEAFAPALGTGAELGLPLKPGRLVIGLRYLAIELGKTSQGDRLTGNSAGFIGDVGYKMTF